MDEKLSEGPSSQENIISRLCCLKISKKRGLSIHPDIHVANSVIILVSILCISINNILTLFIMTRPVYSGQVNSSC